MKKDNDKDEREDKDEKTAQATGQPAPDADNAKVSEKKEEAPKAVKPIIIPPGATEPINLEEGT